MSWYLTGFAHEPMCGGDVADVIGDDGEPKTCCLNIKDAKLIAAAGTARARAEEMGYDGQASVEALPELLDLLKQYVTACRDQDIKLGSITGDAKAVLNKAKGGRG